MENPQDLKLISGSTELLLSPQTGKITQLRAHGEELLVLPLAHERTRALTPEARASFESLDAWGGDECFPTIGRSTLWNLRDHGDLWAQTPTVFFGRDNECFTGWQKDGEFYFKRSVSALPVSRETRTLGVFQSKINFPSQTVLRRANGSLQSDLRVISTYASHALFAAEPKDRIEWATLPGVTQLDSALEKIAARQTLASQVFAEDGSPVASKFYMRTSAPQIFITTLIRHRLRLRIDVLQDSSLPWVGLWWCHNGWGDGRPHSTIGIEPTNCPSDGPVLGFPALEPNHDHSAQFLWVISEY